MYNFDRLVLTEKRGWIAINVVIVIQHAAMAQSSHIVWIEI